MTEHTHRHHDHGADHGAAFDTPDMAAYAELEGEVLLDLVTDAVSLLAELSARHGLQVRRVLDLGSGPGVATCCLAQRFSDAIVVAVDGAATMLERAEVRAQRLGLASRVETRVVEFPAGFGTLDCADLVWASMVIHHVGDEVDALTRIREVLEPGGLLAVVEWGEPLRVLPDDADLGRPPGLWSRLDAAWTTWFADMRAGLPESIPSADYPSMLEGAGFEVLVDEVLRLVLDPPLGDQARRLAHRHIDGTRSRLESYADAADLEALDVLVDEHGGDGILHRADARLTASRRLYVARR